MRTFLILQLSVWLCCDLSGQPYARLKVWLDNEHPFEALARMGLDTDHGHLQPYKYFVSEFSEAEGELLRAAGFRTTVLIPDLAAYRSDAASETSLSTRNSTCSPPVPSTDWSTPSNYQAGSMGGYFTYQEMLDNLDAMAQQYPQLISVRTPITTDYTTHEGRPVYWIRISDQPQTTDPSEPAVLYTALHHAREPNSLSQLIFFMWYLLENYGSDEEVTYLVDNLSLVFVPCVNPDGYLFNEANNPNGGGMWRKNRRPNGNGSFGVDLNRNYGLAWGHDNIGSSPNTDAQTYRGPGPFSEPETRMIRDLCLAHPFRIALNYHTFGNLLVYPWGFTDSATPDHGTFTAFGQLMTRENDFLAGFSTQTVGYTVNGVSDDWMYGEQTTKDKIFSMTPEVGPGTWGFWPPSSAIDDLNRNCMRMNLLAAHLALNYGRLQLPDERYLTGLQQSQPFNLTKYGLASGALDVSLQTTSDLVQETGNGLQFGLFHLEQATDAIPYTLSPSIQPGDTVHLEMVLSNGQFTWRQPFHRIFAASGGPVWTDSADDASAWDGSTDWGITTQTYHSAPSCLTDSPAGDYSPNNTNELVLSDPLVLQDLDGATLRFFAKWQIEADEDYAQALVSVNGGSYQALCGRHTQPGTAEQILDEPVYDGNQPAWVEETVDLSPFLSPDGPVSLRFAFRMVSDDAVSADGFYLDDLTVTGFKADPISHGLSLADPDWQVRLSPNPAHDFLRFDLSGYDGQSRFSLDIANGLGQTLVRTDFEGPELQLQTAGWLPGLYVYTIRNKSGQLRRGRFVIQR
jgi:hypothetical protein